MNHLALAPEAGEDIDLARFITPNQEAEIQAAFSAVGWQNIVGVREKLSARYSYEVLRIYRARRRTPPTNAYSDTNGDLSREIRETGRQSALRPVEVVPLSP